MPVLLSVNANDKETLLQQLNSLKKTIQINQEMQKNEIEKKQSSIDALTCQIKETEETLKTAEIDLIQNAYLVEEKKADAEAKINIERARSLERQEEILVKELKQKNDKLHLVKNKIAEIKNLIIPCEDKREKNK